MKRHVRHPNAGDRPQAEKESKMGSMDPSTGDRSPELYALIGHSRGPDDCLCPSRQSRRAAPGPSSPTNWPGFVPEPTY